MKGTIGGLDGDGRFWCRSCILADTAVEIIIASYISTTVQGGFKCNMCNEVIENTSHLEGLTMLTGPDIDEIKNAGKIAAMGSTVSGAADMRERAAKLVEPDSAILASKIRAIPLKEIKP